MKPPATSEAFLQLVRYSGLVDARSLDEYLRRYRAVKPLPNAPGKLARRMVRHGLLTYFQAAQLLRGKYQGFVLGTYLLLERLGSGSTRSLFLAVDTVLRRRVAIEIVTPSSPDDPLSQADPQREAVVADLDHPNLARAHGTEQVENLCLRLWEYVDGTSLQRIVQQRGPLEVLRAAHYVRQAAEGLQYLHEAGLVHDGINPDNLLLERRGTVKILEPASPRLAGERGPADPGPGSDPAILVTAAYRAPDQALGHAPPDIRSDIYSLGATYFFLLTGQLPWAEDLAGRLLRSGAPRNGEPAHDALANMPETVQAVLVQMMAPDPAQRYATPGAVADALAAYTQTPIPPPPEDEMPRLSPVASRAWALACQRVQAASGMPADPVGSGEMLGDRMEQTVSMPGPEPQASPASNRASANVTPEGAGETAETVPGQPLPAEAADTGAAGSTPVQQCAGRRRKADAVAPADDPLPGEIPTLGKPAPKRTRRRPAPANQAAASPPVPDQALAAAPPKKQAWGGVPPIKFPTVATKLLTRVKKARWNQPVMTAAVLVGVIVLCASAVATIVSNTKGGKEEVPAPRVNGEEMLRDFLASEVAATVKYMGKPMEVEGIVCGIDSDGVQLQVGKASRGKLYCDPADGAHAEVAVLKKGDKLVARGVCGGATASIPGVRMLKCDFRRP